MRPVIWLVTKLVARLAMMRLSTELDRALAGPCWTAIFRSVA